MKLEFFPTNIKKNNQKPNFMKICPVAAKLFHANGQKDTYDEAFAILQKRLKCLHLARLPTAAITQSRC
jgi:hypothetical protein